MSKRKTSKNVSEESKPHVGHLPSEESSKNRKKFIFFGLKLAVIMVVYFWIYNQTFFDLVNVPVVRGYAWAGKLLLNLFGQGATNDGSYIANHLFSMDISKGCDALTPTLLFLAAVLAFPIKFRHKLPALAVAPPALALLNIIRITSLFLIGAYMPSLFEFAHIELWQVLFILACFIGWVYWLIWANKKESQA